MNLQETVEAISAETEAAVDRLFELRRSRRIDERTFLHRSAAQIDTANARATVAVDVSVAKQAGKEGRPTVKPFSDRVRLRGAVEQTATDKDGKAEDPEKRRMRVKRIAKSEPHSTAQDTMPEAMQRHGFRGWIRVPNKDACPLCRRWADGKPRSPKTRMVRHPGCTCIQRPVSGRVAAGAEVVVAPTKSAAKFAAQKAGALARQKTVEYAAAFMASPADEIIVSGAALAVLRAQTRQAVPKGPTIFDRIRQFEEALGKYGVPLEAGQYMVHGSGLLDALNLRAAGDLDVIAHPDFYERVKHVPGWRPLQAGVNKDVEILSNPEFNIQIAKAVEETPTWRRQITVADLEESTVTLRGRQFIKPELLAEMKSAAIREGAKVPKNVRDIALLDGRLTWHEDVKRFGALLNNSRLTPAQERALARMRHPAFGGRQARTAMRAGAAMRVGATGKVLRPIATLVERRALQRYGKGSFGLNRRLREGVQLSPSEQKLVQLIDQALAKQHTPFRVKTYRGLRMTRDEALEMYGDKVGTILRDRSYTSTGLREAVARKYGQSGVYMEFDIPAGTNGYYAPYRALTPEATPNKIVQAFGEDELLLPRGLPYKITAIEERADGTILIKAEIVPTAMPTPPAPGAGRIVAQAREAAEPPPRISVPRPTAKAAGQRAPGTGPAMHPDLIEDVRVADTIRRQAAVPGFEDFAARVAHAVNSPVAGRVALRDIVKRMADEIAYAAGRSWDLNPEAAALHAEWYPFANRWLGDLVDTLPKHPPYVITHLLRDHALSPEFPTVDLDGLVELHDQLHLPDPTALGPGPALHAVSGNPTITPAGAYAAAAALSPGADWADNVAWAKRLIETIARQDDIVVDEAWINARHAADLGVPRRSDLIGKRLSELSDEDAAVAIRGWHDVEPTRQLGGHAGFGNPEYLTVPQSGPNLIKAVSVLRDSSVENIDRQLGGQKVRSFYSNLADPLDELDLDVTIDTHHYGVANGFPWTISTRFIASTKDNLTDTPKSGTAGVAGTYPLVVEATRRAATQFNRKYGTSFFPDQIQSIAWEFHRALYPAELRRGPKFARLMDSLEDIRSRRARGEITRAKERALAEKARLDLGYPTMEELAEWFAYDVRGEDRPTLRDLRAIMRARKGQN